MHTLARRPAPAALTLSVVAVLGGCALLQPTPDDAQRDASSGQITAAADADVFQIAVGDCLADEGGEGEVMSVATVPCSEPHGSEIYGAQDVEEGDFPGMEALETQADDLCYDQFPGFVGMAYEESVLEFSFFTPTEDSWAAGDRELMCILIDPEGGVTGSLENANR